MALEMYRIEEEKAINHLADILTAYGIDHEQAVNVRFTEVLFNNCKKDSLCSEKL